MTMHLRLFLVLFLIIHNVTSVDRSKFKTCEQSSFCRRCRKISVEKSAYELDLETLKLSDSTATCTLINTENGVKFIFMLMALKDDMLRIRVNEENPLRNRYYPSEALNGEPEEDRLQEITKNDKTASFEFGENHYRIELNAVPFNLNVFVGDQLIISVNSRGLFRFEHTSTKPENWPIEGEDPGTWDENFGGHHDDKPHGPTAVALDISFGGAKAAYGLPEHADSLRLKTTTKGEPYRFYNLDVFEYELDNPMALYTSIPVLYAHSEERTVGVFWLNPSETWVDVENNNENVVSSIVNLVAGSTGKAKIDTHFMSESGNIDMFLMLGPRPIDCFKQYTRLTGNGALPPYFSLGYHQCRWNYNDEADVDNVDKLFDVYDIPMDAMWLDIEHTETKKYFTWDHIKFSDPLGMQANLTARGRKLVVIVDPHIKRESGYFLHEDATSNGYYVKNKDNNDYEGWCWPGSSSYLDFMNPAVRDYYASRYKLNNYIGSTENLHLWNDMNEPSVFNGPEITMPKDNIHFGGWEHREIHNLYGLWQVRSTYQGMCDRTDPPQRPFILTRSAFSGSQRYTAIWTGDNSAQWSHLTASIPMCLSLAIGGMSFCGADVGGFFGNPDKELIIRWYQTGIYLPFFRAHAHIDTKRREPWTFDDDVTNIIRRTIRKRYSLLPFWYTEFHKYNSTGQPVINPLWSIFTDERDLFDIDDQFLIGDSLMVKPVTASGQTQISVHFPGSKTIWYDVDDYKIYRNGKQNIPVTIEKTPVYQMGGRIIPKQERVRRSSQLMKNDPYTLIVALDKNGYAEGFLYLDDGVTFDYKNKKETSSVLIRYRFKDDTLSSEYVGNNRYETSCWLERVIILGLKHSDKYKAVGTNSKGEKIKLGVFSDQHSVIIRKPGLNIGQTWNIKIE